VLLWINAVGGIATPSPRLVAVSETSFSTGAHLPNLGAPFVNTIHLVEGPSEWMQAKP